MLIDGVGDCSDTSERRGAGCGPGDCPDTCQRHVRTWRPEQAAGGTWSRLEGGRGVRG